MHINPNLNSKRKVIWYQVTESVSQKVGTHNTQVRKIHSTQLNKHDSVKEIKEEYEKP